MSSKDSYYFPHDATAHTDPKVVKMIMVKGWAAYGLYWMLVERLRSESDNRLPMDIESLAWDAHTEPELVSWIITESGLFESSDSHFWSKSLIRRMKVFKSKSAAARKAAQKRWDSATRDADAMRTHSERNASKVKHSKVKQSKVEDSPPVQQEKSEDIVAPVEYLLKMYPQLDQANAENIYMNNKRTHPDMSSKEWIAIVNDAVAKSEVNKPVRDIPRGVVFSASDYYKAKRIEAERAKRFQGPAPPPQTVKPFEPDPEINRTPEEQAEVDAARAKALAAIKGCVASCTLPDAQEAPAHRKMGERPPVAEATPEQLAQLEAMRARADEKKRRTEDNTKLTKASAEGVI